MSNMHRIHWFDEQIRSGRYPNSSLLAREFEISRRQAQRDIEYMAATLRAPLVYMAKYRGYCYEDQTYRLPQLYMTEEEQRVLKYLAHRYRHYDYDRSDAVKRVAHLLERFTEEDSESEGIQEAFPSFSAAPRQLQYRELLSHAIKESRVVHMHYQDHEGERQFPFCPLGFVSRFNADYVAGYETDPLQNMLLRLEGVRRIRLSDERFVCDAAANQSIWERPLPVRKPFLAEILLPEICDADMWMGYRIRERKDRVYTIEFYDADTFEEHLFTSEWEELLAPKWLRQRLQNHIARMAARLDRTNGS